MKKITLLIFIFTGFNLYSQADEIDKKNIAWFSPSSATHVNGLMFNFWSREDTKLSNIYPVINGIEFNINPIGFFTPFIFAIHSIDPDTHQPSYESIDLTKCKKVNGLQIGLIDMEKSIINGLDINATGSFDTKTNGITLSLVMNKHYAVNGLTIAAIGNHDINCNGIQIALFNSCQELNGIQIGLWNVNQKRRLPFINWNFKN